MFCHAQQKVKLINVRFSFRSIDFRFLFFFLKVAELQALNPTAEPTELISAICGDTHWLQEVREEKRIENELFSLISFSFSIDSLRLCNRRMFTYSQMLKSPGKTCQVNEILQLNMFFFLFFLLSLFIFEVLLLPMPLLGIFILFRALVLV